MSFLKKHAASARIAAIVVVSAVSFTACATNQYVDEKFAAVNTRIDQVDARVSAATQRAEAGNSAAAAAASSAGAANTAAQAAATDARTANQRLDQLTGRVDAMEKAPAKKPRG
jgi:tetrahydromethanopterin S-methyltransferase subunit G